MPEKQDTQALLSQVPLALPIICRQPMSENEVCAVFLLWVLTCVWTTLQEKHVSHKFQGKETVESGAFESPNHLWGAQLGTPVLHRHNPLPTTDEEKEQGP